MRRATVLLLVAATLLVGVPVVSASAATDSRPVAPEDRALALLGAAARASASLTWSGTQYASSWRVGASTSAVVDVSHVPGVGTSVQTGTGERVTVPSPVVDRRLLSVLAAEYDLVVADDERCSGRLAQVVEARRGGVVAGRFWLDQETGLVLRREVYDRDGSRLRSTAFVDLAVDSAADTSGDGPDARTGLVGVRRGRPDDGAGARVPSADLRGHAWLPRGALPGGYALVDARSKEHDGTPVLHLVWSDGLSTQSLFAQPGSLSGPPGDGYVEEELEGGARVWTLADGPERVVWSGGGQVFTLVSEAPPGDVRSAVLALPHDEAPDTGVTARLGRGLGRIGSWLNPFA